MKKDSNIRGLYLTVITLHLLFAAIQLTAQTTPIQTNVPSLHEVYANDFTIGCLLSYRHVGFPTDPYVSGQSAVIAPKGGDLIKYHMNCMSPGNNMKTAYTIDLVTSNNAYKSAATQAEKDSIDIHPIIKFNGDLIAQLNWAKRQGFSFRGHTLVWHSSAPSAFFRSGYTETGTRLSKEFMTLRMEHYIGEIIRKLHENWPGMLTAIDVVNEAISDGNGAFRTTGNEWYTTFGDPTYVMKAFELARKYTLLYNEPQLKLYYNDYNTSSSVKADGIVQLCKPIFEAGFLDGIGMQEHDSNTNPSAQAWVNSYNKFNTCCSEMAITELDISTNSGTNTPSTTVLETQANQYAMLFKCFVERSYYSGRGKIINVSKDGLNDQYTFVTNQSSSLWDTNNQCKPSFYAVVNVGNYYNLLDSLIDIVQNLDGNNYSPQDWTVITNSINTARGALTKNYSASLSAVTGLADAITILEDVLNMGHTGIGEISSKIAINACNGFININNIKTGSRISNYNLKGVLLHTLTAPSSTISVPYNQPCIVKVISGKETKILKVFH